MPCHRPVTVFPRRIPPRRGTIRAGMQYLTCDAIKAPLKGWIITASVCSPVTFLQWVDGWEEVGKGGERGGVGLLEVVVC